MNKNDYLQPEVSLLYQKEHNLGLSHNIYL